MVANSKDVEVNVKATATAEGFDALALISIVWSANRTNRKRRRAEANAEFTQTKAEHQSARDALREIAPTRSSAEKETEQYHSIPRVPSCRVASVAVVLDKFEAGSYDNVTTVKTKGDYSALQYPALGCRRTSWAKRLR